MATAAIVSLSGTAAERASAAGVATGLDAEVRASWTGLPLRAWAERAGELAGMPVIVDRRIDPDTPVTIDCRGEPLRDVLDRVAAVAGAKVDVLRSSVRIVPRPLAGLAENAERARDERLARLPPGRRKAAAARQRWSWPVAARPHDLLVAAAREAGLDIAGLDEVPHDHFPAAALPALSLAERLDLVLAHFDRRLDWHDDPQATVAATVVPIDSAPKVAARPPRPPASGSRVPGKQPSGDKGRDVFTLRLEAPLDQALAAVAGRLGLTLDLDADSLRARGIAPGEIVRADVRNASRDELLRAIVEPLGLEWRIDGQTLRVGAPAAEPPPP
jgi:hypothetical protein